MYMPVEFLLFPILAQFNAFHSSSLETLFSRTVLSVHSGCVCRCEVYTLQGQSGHMSGENILDVCEAYGPRTNGGTHILDMSYLGNETEVFCEHRSISYDETGLKGNSPESMPWVLLLRNCLWSYQLISSQAFHIWENRSTIRLTSCVVPAEGNPKFNIQFSAYKTSKAHKLRSHIKRKILYFQPLGITVLPKCTSMTCAVSGWIFIFDYPCWDFHNSFFIFNF